MFGLGTQEIIIILIILGVPTTVVIAILLLTGRGGKRTVMRDTTVFCTKCGKQNYPNALYCVQCGNALQKAHQYGSSSNNVINIPNYLAQAILVTIFCCLPFGIPAIVYAAQVNGKLTAGNYEGALETSKKAKMWCWISFWVGLGFGIIYLLGVVIGGIAGR